MTKTNQFKLFAVMAAVALALCLLALVAAQPAEAAFPGKNGKIAFDRAFRIWVKNPSLGAQETKLRDEGFNDSQAAYSPDGSRVAFVRRNPGPEIYVTNADKTGTPRRLTNNSVVDSNPVWSHDGTRIAFERDGDVWTMNADGTNQRALTATELSSDNPKFDPTGPSSMPSWSVPLPGAPDGKIAFWHQGWLWTMLANGSGKDDLDYTCPTENGGVCDNVVADPNFSPDGSQIAAVYYGDIFTVSSSGGEASLLTPGSEQPVSEGHPAWSPDGSKIAFQASPTGGTASQIYLASASNRTAAPTQITENGGVNPDWQPIPVCTKVGTSGNDSLTGTTGKDVICGLGGNDTINGVGGNDIVLGGGGNDRLIGASGNDTLNGGPGTDTALYPGSTAVRANLTTAFATGVGMDVLLAVENLTGSGANDWLTGSSATNVLVGGNGADALSGLGGPDTLNSRDGVNGNDTLNGGAGTDNCIKDTTEKSVKSCP